MKKNIALVLLAIFCLSACFGLVSVHAQALGYITVITEPVPGRIYIDSEYAGEGYYPPSEKQPGTYKITFGEVSGYITPVMQKVEVTSDNTTTVRVTYEPLPYATCTIEPTPTPPSTLAPIIQLYSTRTTVTSQQPGLLTISAVNIMGNPVMTAETVFTVDSGVEVMGVGTPFVSSGAGQYIGKFIVLPEEEKHYTVSVRALREDLTSFTVKAQTIYYFGSDIANRQMVQNTITFDVVLPTPTPAPASTTLPAPAQPSDSTSILVASTPTPTPQSPCVEAVFTITCWITIAYWIRRKK
jgi:hypothetical protein